MISSAQLIDASYFHRAEQNEEFFWGFAGGVFLKDWGAKRIMPTTRSVPKRSPIQVLTALDRT